MPGPVLRQVLLGQRPAAAGHELCQGRAAATRRANQGQEGLAPPPPKLPPKPSQTTEG